MFLSFFHCRVSQITRRLRQHHNQTVLDYKPQATPAEQDRLMSILDLVKNSSNHLPEKAGYDFQQRCSEAGLQKVGTAGTGGTGKKNDLLGKKCLFSTLSYTFLMENLRFILVVVRESYATNIAAQQSSRTPITEKSSKKRFANLIGITEPHICDIILRVLLKGVENFCET